MSRPRSIGAGHPTRSKTGPDLLCENFLYWYQARFRPSNSEETPDAAASRLLRSGAMTTPNYPQLATTFQQLTDKAQSLVQQFQKQGTAGSPQLVSITTPGSYTVQIPSGATSVDMIARGGGGGGGGYDDESGVAGGTDGGETTASVNGGGVSIYATGGTGGGEGDGGTAGYGGDSPSVIFNGQSYTGGIGGAAGDNSAGGNGASPGGGGGGGAGGTSGTEGGGGGGGGGVERYTQTISSGMTEIAVTVGAGGIGGASSTNAPGGNGGDGAVYLYFHT